MATAATVTATVTVGLAVPAPRWRSEASNEKAALRRADAATAGGRP